MSRNRRDFLRVTAAAGGALGLGLVPDVLGAATPPAAPPAREPTHPRRAIRLLILGGTGFIGPHQVRYAVERGHDVTIFNRGSNPDMFPGVTELTGDRAANDYRSLEGKTWDAVIDNSASRGDAPEWVRDAATLLRDRVQQYLFISTRSVFRDLSQVPATVDAPTFTPETTPNWQPGQTRPYGLAKAEAEREALKVFGERATIVRPGLIVGPGDDTDRFTYWPVRVSKGGDVLAPNSPDEKIQCIDVRDLANFMVHTLEQKTKGIFNADAPAGSLTIGRLLETSRTVAKSDARPVYVPTAFLEAQKVRPWADMPVWIPASGDQAGSGQISTAKAQAAGLAYRPLVETVTDTLAWCRTWPKERQDAPLKAGITPEREAAVLAAWEASKG